MRGLTKTNLQVLGLFLVLAVLGTWPVAGNLFTKLAGDGGDAYHGIWAIWWLDEAVAGRVELFGTNDLIFHPIGAPMANDSLSLANGLISLPLQRLFGLVPAYNLLFLLSYWLAGWGMYCFARRLELAPGPAILAGLVFAWSPYHVVHSFGHLDLLAIQWLPLFFICYLEVLRGTKGWWPLGAGLFYALAALSAWYYLIYLGLAALILWLAQLARHRCRRPPLWWRQGLLTLLAAALLLAPVLLPILSIWRQQGFVETEDALWYSMLYSADLAAFFTPPTYHPFFGDLVRPRYQRFTANLVEGTVYLGYPVLVLALVGLVRGGDRRRWWLAVGILLALVLAVGPIAQLFGQGLVNVKLPYYYLLQLPFFAHQQAASRSVVLAYFGLALLAAMGAGKLLERRNPAFRTVGLIVAGIVIFVDYLCIPFPMSPGKIPEFYRQVAADTGKTVLLELPGAQGSRWQYYQTVHRQPLINGYISRIPKESRRAQDGEPLYRYLFDEREHDLLLKLKGATPSGGYRFTDADRQTLRNYSVRYVVLHPEAKPELTGSLQNALERLFGRPGEWTDGLLVWRVE